MRTQPSLGKLAINCHWCLSNHTESVLGFWDGWICGNCYRNLTRRSQASPLELEYTLRFFDWLDIVRGNTPRFMRLAATDYFEVETTELDELKRWADISRVAIVFRPDRAVEQLYVQGFATVPIEPETPGDKKRVKWQAERERIAEVLREDPELSDHTVALNAELHHATVAKTRHVLELRREIPVVRKRMGADGRVRRTK